LSAALGAESDISVRKFTHGSPPLCFSFVQSLVVVLSFLTHFTLFSWHTDGGGTTLRTPVYNLFPVDLRTSPDVSLASLLSAGHNNDDGEPTLSPTLPTLLLFECVLAYMNPTESNALIRWFVDYFSTAAPGGLLSGVVYEMFKLNDAFGRVMLNNLKVCDAVLSPLNIRVCSHLIPFFSDPYLDMTLT
jgi:hypothetical protein